jgi:hypothetical protein
MEALFMHEDEPVNELKSTTLWNYLNELDSNYADKAISFVQWISPLLASINEYFPNYTRHDAHHSYRILNRIEQIIDHDCLNPGSTKYFNAEEAFLLITAAYGHDLGMRVFPGEEPKLIYDLNLSDTNWKTEKDLQDYLRNNHSTRGIDYIVQNIVDNEMPLHLISYLSDVMRSHNLTPDELEIQLGKRIAAGEKEIDLKQLACILCIGDALEFSDTRVIDGVIERLSLDKTVEGLKSYRENMKHVGIGSNVAIGDDGRIIFAGTFTDTNVLALTHHTVDLIEDWVQQYCDIDYRSFNRRLQLRSDRFSRNLDIPNVDFERLGIRLKKENIINLIASDSTWSNDPVAPIRELLQNSVEACRYRKHNTPSSKKYKPSITVSLDRKILLLSIRDNGCGMGRGIILNSFLNVGNSRSISPTYQSHDYYSLARFGIGFWSVFTIASEAIIETSPFELQTFGDDITAEVDGMKFEVTLDELADYTVFYRLKRSPGTSIALKLKQDVDVDKIIGTLSTILLCSEIPIKIIITDDAEFCVPPKPPLLSEQQIFGSRMEYAKENEVKIFNWQFEDELIELAMNLTYRIKDGKATFLLADNESSMSFVIERHFLLIKTGVCGFPAAMPINLCFDLGRVGMVSANVKSPKGFKYSLDRRRLLPSDELLHAGQRISQAIHEGYREFLRKNNSYDQENIYKLNRQSRRNGGEVYDSYTKSNLRYANEDFPDLISFKLYEVTKDRDFNHAKIVYVDLTEIQQLHGRVWCCQNCDTKQKGAKGLYIDPENIVGTVYDVVKKATHNAEHQYIMEPCIESSMLFDNCKDSAIFIIPADPIKLLLMAMPLESLDLNSHPHIVGNVAGSWAGTIYENRIVKPASEYNFTFLGRHRMILNRNSGLSKYVRGLYRDGKIFSIANLFNKLQEIKNGHIEETLFREIGEFL